VSIAELTLKGAGGGPAELCFSPMVNYLSAATHGLRYHIILRSRAAVHADRTSK
jgi:hypothetical protein